MQDGVVRDSNKSYSFGGCCSFKARFGPERRKIPAHKGKAASRNAMHAVNKNDAHNHSRSYEPNDEEDIGISICCNVRVTDDIVKAAHRDPMIEVHSDGPKANLTVDDTPDLGRHHPALLSGETALSRQTTRVTGEPEGETESGVERKEEDMARSRDSRACSGGDLGGRRAYRRTASYNGEMMNNEGRSSPAAKRARS